MRENPCQQTMAPRSAMKRPASSNTDRPHRCPRRGTSRSSAVRSASSSAGHDASSGEIGVIVPPSCASSSSPSSVDDDIPPVALDDGSHDDSETLRGDSPSLLPRTFDLLCPQLNTSFCVSWSSIPGKFPTHLLMLSSGRILKLGVCRTWRGVIAPWSSECTSVPELLVSWREWDMCRIEFIEDLPDTDGIIFDVAETGVSVPVQTLIDLARQHGLVLPRSAQGLDH